MKHYLYNGDNIEVLNKIKKDYIASVDLILIDPPYNTGKKMGKYSDNFRSHHDWVAFMRPRIQTAHELLSASGMIFINIGEQEFPYLRLLCDEIFGEDNRISTIYWQCQYTVRNDKSGISVQTEPILVYAKNAKKAKINRDPLRPEYVAKSYKNPDNDPRGLWRGGIQLYKKKNKHSYTVTSPSGKQFTKPWNYSKDQWRDVLEKDNLLYWGPNGDKCPVKKVFLDRKDKGTAIRNLWLGKDVGYTADGGKTIEEMFGDRNKFLYPKPVKLIKRMLQIAARPDSIVMDFFAGSGTVGHAVLEYNRDNNTKMKFVLITNDENRICSDVAFPRLEKVIGGFTDTKGVKHLPTGGTLEYSETQNITHTEVKVFSRRRRINRKRKSK